MPSAAESSSVPWRDASRQWDQARSLKRTIERRGDPLGAEAFMASVSQAIYECVRQELARRPRVAADFLRRHERSR